MSAFETTIRLQLDKFSPAEAQKKHVAVARAGLAAFLAGQSMRPDVQIEVDGHVAASETEVRPFGVIRYRFSRMREIALFALAAARNYSPVRSGRYRDAWFLMMDDAPVTPDAIGAGSVVTIANDQPYSRKINVGAKGFEKYAPPGVVEKTRQLVLSRYRGVVTAEVVFIQFPDGHVLVHSQRRKYKNGRLGGLRRDAMKGMRITYPALLLTPKFR